MNLNDPMYMTVGDLVCLVIPSSLVIGFYLGIACLWLIERFSRWCEKTPGDWMHTHAPEPPRLFMDPDLSRGPLGDLQNMHQQRERPLIPPPPMREVPYE